MNVFTFYQYCMKSVQIQSEYTEIYGPEITPYLDTFHAVKKKQRKKPSKDKFNYRKKRWK